MNEITDIAKDVVCEYYKLDPILLYSKTRKREIVWARQVAMKLAKENSSLSFKDIAYNIGKKDHATCIHSMKTVNNLCETDKKLMLEFEEIKLIFLNKIPKQSKYNSLLKLFNKIKKKCWRKVYKDYCRITILDYVDIEMLELLNQYIKAE